MDSRNIRTGIKIGIAAALGIILFQVSNVFLVYKYFKFDYYVTAVAIIFLLAGFFISKYKQPVKNAADIGEGLIATLTTTELFILKQIADGKSNKEIAAANFVEISTVKTHINNIYAKLRVQNRREATGLYKTASQMVINLNHSLNQPDQSITNTKIHPFSTL